MNKTEDISNFPRTIRTRKLDFVSDFDLELSEKYIFILKNQNESLSTFELISKTKRQSSILIFTDDFNYEKFISDLEKIKKNSYFYLIHGMKIDQVITINNVKDVIINEVIQEKNGNFIEIYNLQGLHMTCISLSYPPFLLLYGCNRYGQKCRTSGTVPCKKTCFFRQNGVFSDWNKVF